MDIKILGSGCATCRKLTEMVRMAVDELGINASVAMVTDTKEIAKHAESRPGLLINNKLMHAGKPLPTLEKIKEYLMIESSRGDAA